MTQSRYSAVAILLHWVIAALLVWIVLLGWEAGDLEGAAKIAPLQLHKPLGILVLLPAVLVVAIPAMDIEAFLAFMAA